MLQETIRLLISENIKKRKKKRNMTTIEEAPPREMRDSQQPRACFSFLVWNWMSQFQQ